MFGVFLYSLFTWLTGTAILSMKAGGTVGALVEVHTVRAHLKACTRVGPAFVDIWKITPHINAHNCHSIRAVQVLLGGAQFDLIYYLPVHSVPSKPGGQLQWYPLMRFSHCWAGGQGLDRHSFISEANNWIFDDKTKCHKSINPKTVGPSL